MENKYLEKIAFLKSPAFAGAAIGAGFGAVTGGIGAGVTSKAIGGKNTKKDIKDGAVIGALIGAVQGAQLGPVFHRARRGSTYHPPASSVSDHLKHFGVSKSSFKTKAEAAKHFKSKLHKAHPDKGGDTGTFQKLNTAREHILKSDWFEKLAMTNKYIAAMSK